MDPAAASVIAAAAEERARGLLLQGSGSTGTPRGQQQLPRHNKHQQDNGHCSVIHPRQ
jgi:hypothetical protein